MKHFGLLTCPGSNNLGDEIQNIAARRFLPRVDCYISREDLPREPACEGDVRAILNGWFLHHPEHWPPHPRIKPLLTSFHISQLKPSRWRLWKQTPANILLAPKHIGYLREHGPVGARDKSTLSLLEKHGVESFYSACLTLTLPSFPDTRREETIACDLDAESMAVLLRRLHKPPIVTTHIDAVTASADERLGKAEELLRLYADARLVVTSRLHCALPCLAFGTPVLFICRPEQMARQQPAVDLAHHVSRDDFLAESFDYDVNDPPPNSGAHMPFARDLAARCQSFLGGRG